ncbi:MAG: hypothetical protein ACOY3P_24625 [Planctomycetota bacterium]
MYRSAFAALLAPLLLSAPLLAEMPLNQEASILRIRELESETAALRAQLAAPRPVVRLPSVAGAPSAVAPSSTLSAEVVPASANLPFEAPGPADDQYFTLPQLQAEMKKLVWKKGDFTITPYGWIWGAAAYETSRSQTGDFTFYVFSAQDQGESAFHVNAKGTRLGLDIAGPRLPFCGCPETGGKVEIDFEGQFLQENKPGVLLRHAYWEAKNEDYRLLFGQTWDVISPLYPNSLMYSIYWGAGNIGYRRAQIRGERYLAANDRFLLTLQGSLNVDIVSEFPSGASTGFQGDHSAWPVLEGRTAITLGPRGKGCNPITLGLSGHIGEQVFDFTAAPADDDVYVQTWSCNLDLKAPVTDRFGFQGELFFGENLGAYLGGILQGVNVATREGIYSQGGWFEVYYYWTPKLHTHVGYTVDDPLDSDLTLATARRFNQAYWGNICCDVTPKLLVGIEVSQWKTLFVDRLPGESTRIDFLTRYSF